MSLRGAPTARRGNLNSLASSHRIKHEIATLPLVARNDKNTMILPHSFYDRATLIVARELIGARLVRILDGMKLVGFITETEAYIGEKDLGCHAHVGKTNRNAVMYGPPGHAYVYFTYGNHWMLNAVTEREGFPAAVLIRAIQPIEGIEVMSERRSGRDTFGPGKLTQAMGITKSENGIDLTESNDALSLSKGSGLWIEAGAHVPNSRVTKSPRVGLYSVPEPWKSMSWRFRTTDLVEKE